MLTRWRARRGKGPFARSHLTWRARGSTKSFRRSERERRWSRTKKPTRPVRSPRISGLQSRGCDNPPSPQLQLYVCSHLCLASQSKVDDERHFPRHIPPRNLRMPVQPANTLPYVAQGTSQMFSHSPACSRDHADAWVTKGGGGPSP